MNIKSVVPQPVSPIEPKARVKDRVQTEMSTDRDANGRQESGEGELKRNLSDQEFDDAIKVLQDLPGLKSNDLTIHIELKDDCRVVLVLDPEGQIVRRLSESQLWQATRDKDKHTGRILDKAM